MVTSSGYKFKQINTRLSSKKKKNKIFDCKSTAGGQGTMLFEAQDNKSKGVWLPGYTQVEKCMTTPESIKFRVTESFSQKFSDSRQESAKVLQVVVSLQ